MIWILLIIFWIWGTLPTFHWLDTSELVLASQALGVGHPPGQVLHSMVGQVISIVPVGDLSFRLSIVSGVIQLGGLFTVYRIAKGLCKKAGTVLGDHNLWVMVVLVVWGLSPVLATQALRPEVYSLASALTFLSIYLSLQEKDLRYMYLAWFVFSLAFATHTIIALLALPFLFKRRFAVGVLFAGLGVTAFLFYPIRAAAQAAWNFGDPVHWDRFLWFVRARLYVGSHRAFDRFELIQTTSNAQQIGDLLYESVGLLGLVLTMLGMGWLARHHMKHAVRLVVMMLLVLVPLTLMGSFWPKNPDAGGYLNPVLYIFCVASLVAVSFLPSALPNKPVRRLVTVLFVLWGIVQVVGYVQDVQLKNDWSARRHALYLVEEPEPSAHVLTGSFQTYSLMRYLQVVEGLRPDLRVDYRGMSFSGNSQNRARPKWDRPVWWELALHWNPSGFYTLRPEDLEYFDRLKPQGWFCKVDGTVADSWRSTMLYRLTSIRDETRDSLVYSSEPLLLHYLVHILLARRQGDGVMASNLMQDSKSFFPSFDDYAVLETF